MSGPGRHGSPVDAPDVDDVAAVAEVADPDVAADPDAWALQAYRTALAQSESATGRDDLLAARTLLERAGRVLTAERAPLEHARIQVATGNCERLLGDPVVAAACFERAAALQDGRAAPGEVAASLVDLGLALTEAGRASDAVPVLDDAVTRLETAVREDDDLRRVLGAALVNRAQAHHRIGSDTALRRAADDYRAAARQLDAVSPQRGMALHGLGTVLLAVRSGPDDIESALQAIGDCLSILTAEAFPFQHAVAVHSLAVALEAEGSVASRRRALDSADAALAVFDPRLHPAPWAAAAATLDRLAASLGVDTSMGARAHVFIALVGESDPDDRLELVRQRLVRLERQPEPRRTTELDALMSAVADARDHYDATMRTVVDVLMELPDEFLDGACRALCAAHRRTDHPEQLDADLDAVVHARLHGPQRVRVRDLLESYGWVRP